jgi:hypothetical protein
MFLVDYNKNKSFITLYRERDEERETETDRQTEINKKSQTDKTHPGDIH